MIRVSIAGAKARLCAWVRAVYRRGEIVTITRRGKPVAAAN